jgi:hypothetical protein
MMKIVCSSEKMVLTYQTTRYYNPEDKEHTASIFRIEILHAHSYPNDEGSMFFRKDGAHPPDYTLL